MTNPNASEILVLGSGMTGLCAAALFANNGQEVRVLEAHPMLVGGHARTINIHGHHFSAGPQYVWGFAHGQIGQRLLEALGLTQSLPFRPLDPDGFERLMVDGREPFDVPLGLERFCEKMLTAFPKEEKGIREFFSKITKLFLAGQVISDTGLYLKSFNQMRRGIVFSPRLSLDTKAVAYRMAKCTLEEVFNQSQLSDPVRRLLFGHAGIFAENETDLPAAVYAIATGFYHAGASVPVAGFDGLVDGLCSTIRKNGEVLLGKKVIRLLSSDRRVDTVQCEDGSQYAAKLIVSTLSPRPTYRLLAGQAQDIYDYAPSNSVNTFLIGVRNYSPLAHALQLRNILWQDGQGKLDFVAPDASRLPRMLYLGSPTANGICHGEENDPSRKALIVFSPAAFSQTHKRYLQDPSKYAAARQALADRALHVIAENIFPGILSRIEFCEVRTPWCFSRAPRLPRVLSGFLGGLWGSWIKVS